VNDQLEAVTIMYEFPIAAASVSIAGALGDSQEVPAPAYDVPEAQRITTASMAYPGAKPPVGHPGSRSARRDNGVRAHYDLSNAFYALWLDESMTYSAARWADGVHTLEAAQHTKRDLIARYAGLDGTASGVGSLLDIGCGWGSMLDHARSCGVRNTMGVTLSREQAAWVVDAGHDVRVADWRQLDLPAGSIDAVVSVGCFEHIAEVGASAVGRAQAYGAFFQRCACWLAPGGRLALQTITTGDVSLSPSQQRDVLFLLREIFPYSRLPALSEIMAASSGRLELVCAQ